MRQYFSLVKLHLMHQTLFQDEFKLTLHLCLFLTANSLFFCLRVGTVTILFLKKQHECFRLVFQTLQFIYKYLNFYRLTKCNLKQSYILKQ